MSTVVCIDARSRERRVFAASATRLQNQNNAEAIVLRKAVEVGTVESLHGYSINSPILVVGKYAARSSAGYVVGLGGEKFRRVLWVGGSGFGQDFWDEGSQKNIRRGDGLRPFGRPVRGVLLPAGCLVSGLPTHGNLNQATADAAFEGLRLLAVVNPNLFLLVEGQSNVTTASGFVVPEGAADPDLPEEHRGDIFTPEKILAAALITAARRQFRGSSWPAHYTPAKMAAFLTLLLAVGGAEALAGFGAGLPQEVLDLLGNGEEFVDSPPPSLKKAAEQLARTLHAAGWKEGLSPEYGGRYVEGVSPDGELVGGWLPPDEIMGRWKEAMNRAAVAPAAAAQDHLDQ